ncbi:LrgB family protein [Aestuariibacter sp. AA17]|uniref:LrgB family protein n=1 Tax=Fluctibacter corallii TaxID=2984329 RepID=A0ABT3A7Z8_9ALTE|nr:LrgB family protein [Aestuariibacter sp. AA17]MCV2884802.1 LrgB family protein [Aestuariibacter sp. AA17]
MLFTVIWLLLTVFCYSLSAALYRKCHATPILHPILPSALLVYVFIYLLDEKVSSYLTYTSLIHWMLAPATVVLAVPMFKHLYVVKVLGWQGLAAMLVGGIMGPISCFLILWGSGVDTALLLTSLTKSITTPLAIETAEAIGGIPSIAAVMVILTGISGAMMSQWVFTLTGCSHSQSKGLALGTAAHAVGTSRAALIDEHAVACSSIALCLNGVMTSLCLPIIISMIK